jgi:hypothetical protein
LSILDPALTYDIKKWTDELNDAVEAHRCKQVEIFGEYESLIDHLVILRENFILLHGHLISKKITLSENEIKDVMKKIFRSFNRINKSSRDFESEHFQVKQINKLLQHVLHGDK